MKNVKITNTGNDKKIGNYLHMDKILNTLEDSSYPHASEKTS